MSHGEAPVGVAGAVGRRIFQTLHFVDVAPVSIQVIGSIVTIRIQGIYNSIGIRIKEFHYNTVIRRNPDTPITIIIAYRNNLAHVKS